MALRTDKGSGSRGRTAPCTPTVRRTSLPLSAFFLAGWAAAQVHLHERFEAGRADAWGARDTERTQLTIARAEEHGEDRGSYLRSAGELKWISVTCQLARPVPVRPSLYVVADVRSRGRFGRVSLGVSSTEDKGFTHLKTGPGAYSGTDDWQRVVWRCEGYFPDRDDVLVDAIAFHQRVAGGYERPDGGARHELHLDNVRVVAGGAAEDARRLAAELGRVQTYDGAHSFVLSASDRATVWHSPSAAKVFRDQHPPARSRGAVRLAAARHEYESFQLVVSASEDMEGLALAFSPFEGAGDALIPVGELRWHPVCYLRTHSRTSGSPADQWWPEPLSWNRSFGVPAKQSRPVWVTVHVPEDADAGVYRGSVRLTQGEDELGTVPVELTVWDFRLPRRPTFRTNQQLWLKTPNDFDDRPRRVVWPEVFALLAQYRMSDAHLFHRMGPDLQRQAVEEWGQNAIKLPFAGGHRGGRGRKVTKLKGDAEIMTPEYEEALTDLLTKWTRPYRDKGWLDRAFLYLWDEPWGDFEVHDMVLWLGHTAKRVVPDLKTLVAAPYHEKYDGAVDIFLADYTAPERIRAAQSRGAEFWWWGNSSLAVDLPAIDVRLRFGFESVQKGFTGAYSWGIAVWRAGDPWSTYARDNHASKSVFPGGRPESEDCRLVPGISLELNRDGIEDYEYVTLLRGVPGPEAKALLSRCERFYREPGRPRRSFAAVDDLHALRLELGELLQGNGPE